MNNTADQSAVYAPEIDLRSAAEGDHRAFERLYDSHVGRIQRTLSSRCIPAEIEDLTQEVFIRAWLNLRTFRGDAGLATWLHRIAANVAIDMARATRTRAPFSTSPPDGHLEPVTPAPSVVDRIAVSRAISKLSPDTRRVFILYERDGHSHQEIAAALRVPVGTSKARLHRARRILRRELRTKR